MLAERMFLRSTNRHKDGKDHRYFSVVEKRRVSDGRVVQRRVLYWGEINDSQEVAWQKTLEIFDQSRQQYSTLSLFPDDRELAAEAIPSMPVKLQEMELHRPRACGNCWLGCELWRQLGWAEFWRQRLSAAAQRKTVPGEKVLELLVVNRLIDPGLKACATSLSIPTFANLARISHHLTVEARNRPVSARRATLGTRRRTFAAAAWPARILLRPK